jgi:hypothetical protein
MGQLHWDPDTYLALVHDEVPEYGRLQQETAVATGTNAGRMLELGTGTGRFVLGDVVVPEDPADVVTPLDDEIDKPSTVSEQPRWLEAAGLRARVAWAHRDLAVMVGEPRGV